MARTMGAKSWELLVYPWSSRGVIPRACSASVSALAPPCPKASVACTIAHFLNFIVLTPKSAMTFDEYRSFGLARKTHLLLMRVRLGSVPPIMVGIPDFAIAGDAA